MMCKRCGGTGVVREEYCGEVVIDDCPDCAGAGTVEEYSRRHTW